MANLILPYQHNAFRWIPSQRDHSRASSGYCSICWKLRRAEFMLVKPNGRALLAYCVKHARIRQLRNEVEVLRTDVYGSLEVDGDQQLPTPLRRESA